MCEPEYPATPVPFQCNAGHRCANPADRGANRRVTPSLAPRSYRGALAPDRQANLHISPFRPICTDAGMTRPIILARKALFL